MQGRADGGLRYLTPSLVAAIVGLGIWLPTFALQPLDGQPLGEVYVVLMVIAAVVLAVMFPTRWQVLAPALIGAQFVVARWTTPRGDNDGLWGLIFPMLVAFGAVLVGITLAVAAITRSRVAR